MAPPDLKKKQLTLFQPEWQSMPPLNFQIYLRPCTMYIATRNGNVLQKMQAGQLFQ